MTSHQERLAGLLAAVTSEDMLGGFIRVHLFIEYELNLFIQKRLPSGVLETLRLDYDGKIKLAIALGLASDLKPSLRKVGEFRNEFAHNLDHKLVEADVDALFKSFSPRMKDLMQRAFAKMRRTPSGAHYPATHQELNGATKLQLYILQIWSILAHVNDPTFFPGENEDPGESA
jgi:hypothetical protein